MSLHDHAPIITVPTVHKDGALALYTGALTDKVHLDLGNTIVTTSDTDLAPLAKAILNAVEPAALVENQKDAEPAPLQPGDWVKVSNAAPYNNFRGQTLQVADALRRLADSITEQATPVPAEEPRFYAAHEPEGWGVADRETPEEWAYWSADSSAEADVRRVARNLNEQPDERNSWAWSTYGVGDVDW